MYTLIRSRRKTISVTVTKEAKLEVRAPYGCSVHTIERFLESKKDWIAKTLAHVRERQARLQDYHPRQGIRFLGELIPVTDGVKRTRFDGEKLFVKEITPDIIRKWLQGQARKILKERLDLYAPRMGVKANAFKLSSARTRWGSCSSHGNINLSWRLILFPVEIMDYVVVHELAHLTELNHSPRFWSKVEEVIPDHRQRKKELTRLAGEKEIAYWE
jgi:predicted metal-dependent hydrolase